MSITNREKTALLICAIQGTISLVGNKLGNIIVKDAMRAARKLHSELISNSDYHPDLLKIEKELFEIERMIP